MYFPNSHSPNQPASVVRSEARPAGDQEVAGSIPAGLDNILLLRSSTLIRSLPMMQEGQLSFSGERTCTSTG